MKPVIVVEGTSDVNKLQNFIDADFVITNGSAVSRETINYLKELSLTRKIILLLDPDYPGMRIRSILQNELPDALNAYVNKELSVKGKKLGVCECDKDEIIRALNEVYLWDSKEKQVENRIETKDLFDLLLIGDFSSSERRKFLSNKLPIGKVNGKTLLKRLNQLNISLKELKNIMKEYL